MYKKILSTINIDLMSNYYIFFSFISDIIKLIKNYVVNIIVANLAMKFAFIS